MPWLTHLIKQPITDSAGRSIGRVHDLIADRGRFPRANWVVIRLNANGRQSTATPGSELVVPWTSLKKENSSLIFEPKDGLSEEPSGGELRIKDEVLDQQIVDIEGARVVRVNDVWLSESAGGFRLVGVDTGIRGVLRQLGLENIVNRVVEALGYEVPEKMIAWNYVAPLEEQKGAVRLTVSSRLLRELHPSELADILDQLDSERRERILSVMSDAYLAETLPETEPDVSREAVKVLGEERVRRVLELMPPDEAADLLGNVGYERGERLLDLMGLKEASVLRELLGYPPDTAGGRMTPEFIAVSSSFSAEEAMAQIRREASEAETINYSYVLDDEGRVKGVLSLRQLLRSDPLRPVESLMETDLVSVHLADDQEEVARVMARYDLLALPVVDDAGRLRGIVTVDDIVEVLEEEASEDLSEVTGVYLGVGPGDRTGRLAGFGLSLVGGGAAAVLLESRRPVLASIAAVAWLLPLYLRIAQDVGTWSLARALSGMNLDPRRRLDSLAQELLVGLSSAAAAGLLVGTFSTWWTRNLRAGAFLGIGIFVGSLAASVIGLAVPTFARTLRLGRILSRGRPLAVAVGFASILVYVWVLGSLASRLP